MTLYRKYRPRRFEELVGQEQVTRPLRNAIRTGRIAHAYLFGGPRGSGKTSMAKLFGKAINCQAGADGEPCGSCPICQSADEGRLLDILELDAASNRGIAEIREIRDHVGYAATQARYKVYILDEAHMLTKDASNAFLKTLEEPPPHIVFILVTTEVHKIMPTILSRCQRYDFRKIDRTQAVARLRWVAARESIDLEEDAAHYLVLRGDGSLRDTIGLLEQVASFPEGGAGPITRAVCSRSLGFLDDSVMVDLIETLAAGDPGPTLEILARFDEQGVDARVLARQLVEEIRGLLYLQALGGEKDLYRPGTLPPEAVRPLAARFDRSRLMGLLNRLAWTQGAMRTATFPYFTLELALLGSEPAPAPGRVARPVEPGEAHPAPRGEAAVSGPPPVAARPVPVRDPEPGSVQEPVSIALPPSRESDDEDDGRESADSGVREEAPPPTSLVRKAGKATANAEQLRERWEAILEDVRKVSARTAAVLKEIVRYEVRSKTVTLVVRNGHQFALDSLRNPRHSGLIKEALEKQLGHAMALDVSEESGGPASTPTEDRPRPRPRSRAFEDHTRESVESPGVQQIKKDFQGEVVGIRDPDL